MTKAISWKWGDCERLPGIYGARGGTRTPIQINGLDPKSSASTNFATLADNRKSNQLYSFGQGAKYEGSEVQGFRIKENPDLFYYFFNKFAKKYDNL